MSELTEDEVLALVHPLDDATVAEIIGTGITKAELTEACHLVAKELKSHQHGELPAGRVGRVIAILERVGARPKRSPFGEAGSTLE